jgi:DNA repair protein RecO (recombination protein O)
MQVKTRGIVLSALRYQEKSLIVKCFTEADGLKSYFVRDAFSGKKSASKIAYFQPLTILDIVAVHKNKGTLEYFKEVKLGISYQTINVDIRKTTIVIFLAEVLHHSIREEEKNESLYHFLETAFLWLDSHDDIADFHLLLLLEVTKFLGFYPERNFNENLYFEMTDGIFVPFESATCLNAKETHLLQTLLQLRIDSGSAAFHVTERQALLNILLNYYSLHLEGFRRPNSLEVLKQVFS